MRNVVQAGRGAGASVSPRYAGTRTDGSGFPPVHHIGMVVRDRDRMLANLANTMGFGPAFPFESIFSDVVLANGEMGIALKGAFVWMRNTAVEIVEPMDDRSPHYKFLETRGEGLHHLAYWVDSVRDEIAKMRAGGMRARSPVEWEAHYGTRMVTGFEDALAVLNDKARTSSWRLSEQHHGPAGNRTLRFEPTYSFRSLADLHIEFDPA